MRRTNRLRQCVEVFQKVLLLRGESSRLVNYAIPVAARGRTEIILPTSIRSYKLPKPQIYRFILQLNILLWYKEYKDESMCEISGGNVDRLRASWCYVYAVTRASGLRNQKKSQTINGDQ
ncbi:uncharacterized protein J8A68_004662 [[Candida] subhashii]|uniref:Uncharacterized protein n=1 Tax=[Candida] subhashii TaxID=561895 RepID=A0A8J5QAQ6_9ASCO|nr:uncharacterized protein J8A68_004662 [[Candida] subhashii]KAG7661836.1 hypothetical protein J8A68_004662 [[Candida] subhashii]